MTKTIKKTITFSVEYTTEISVEENELIDSNIDIEIPSGAYCGCSYVENSLKVLSSNKSKIVLNDLVFHKTYGTGKVTKITPLGGLHGGLNAIEIDDRNSDYEINFNKI
jgi:hypothetical protein